MDARAAQPPRKMIIDTDGGIDDLMALALGLRSPEIEILAVTTACLCSLGLHSFFLGSQGSPKRLLLS